MRLLDCIEINGIDAIKFLQGQLTCDVTALPEGDACLGAHCNLQGRILANFIVIKQTSENILLALPHGMAETLLGALQKYAVFSKVTLTDRGSDYCHITMSKSEGAYALPIVNTYLTFNQDADDIDTNAWQASSIEQGIVWVTPKTTAKYTPHAVGFDKAGGVNYNKGCYTGQEIIARMHFRATPKDGLYLGTLQDSQLPAINSPIEDDAGKKHGTVVSTAIKDSTGIFLANLRHEHPGASTLVCVDSSETIAIASLAEAKV